MTKIMEKNFVKIWKARVHNLQGITVSIPKNKLVVITGVSGSGKSSLAFDTLYAEGQRRYVESLSAYARQFLGVMQKPDVEKIEGISPAISIDQRKAAHNPRSTVGTMTEIYDYLRVLFARIGIPHCPKCHRVVSRQTVDQIVDQIEKLPDQREILILGPVIQGKKGEHKAILEEIERAGFIRVRIDGVVQRIEEAREKVLSPRRKHSIEVVVDRLVKKKSAGLTLERSRLADSVETALKLGKGIVLANVKDIKKQNSKVEKGKDFVFSEKFACDHCGISLPEIEPRLFSFNSPYGACPACQGLGKKLEVDPELAIPNKNLSIAEGAIFAWAHASHKIGRQGYFWNQLQDLAERYQFSLFKPVKDLPSTALNIILYGDDRFEGVIPNLERKYWATDSEAVRAEIKKYMREKQCEKCHGKKLREEALAVTLVGKSIDDIVNMEIGDLKKFFEKLKEKQIGKVKFKIAQDLLKEIISRLQFLVDVGLDYLTLAREVDTLAGGEEQRVRLATQIGSKLTGILYILDEPSVGLHSRDQARLIATLKKLRDLGNTVIVVEHDFQTIKEADWVIDIGPEAGKRGGQVVFTGTPKQLFKAHTLTGDYFSGRKKVKVEKSSNPEKLSQQRDSESRKYLQIKKASEHNLKNIDVKIPLGKLVCITGVSGSGKSTLVDDIIAKATYRKFYHSKEEPGKYESMLGLEFLDKVVLVDQSPIGRTPRSNPATYTGAFSYIRELFAKTREARLRGYKAGRFSFNVKGGRCEACEGQGVKKIEMYFLPDIYVTCQDCHGKRYNKETLEVKYKGKDIAEVLAMTVQEALNFFKNIPPLQNKLRILSEVGLGYIELGQSATSLSGGEAQRVKLATELSKKSTGKTLYILDEPTTGLHPDDIQKLVFILKRLVDKGNTVLLIEHNLDVIKNADWIIDLGPEGGQQGGKIVAVGEPKKLIENKKSYTAYYLKRYLKTS